MKIQRFNKINYTLFFFTLIIFLTKWLISYYFYKENIEIKIIFENVDDGWFFLPLIKQLSLLELNNSFSPYVKNLNNLPMSFGSIIFHTLFFKIFSYPGIIIIEFFAILLFLIIFYKMFRQYFCRKASVIFAFLLFSLPAIVTLLNIDKIPYLYLIKTELFSLRIHRPFPSTLYLYLFVYLLIYIDKKNKKNIKYGIFLGITAGLTLSSFYFYFVVQSVFFFLWTIYKFKFDFFKKLIIYINFFISYVTSLVIVILPFILNIFLQEKDAVIRQGIFNLSYDKKIKLLNYNFDHIFNSNFIYVFLLTIVIVYYINSKKILGNKIINIFYLLFLSSIFSPTLFVIISPKASLIYHFYNFIIISLSLFLIIFLFLIIKNFLIKIYKVKLYYSLLITLLITLNIFHVYFNNKPNQNKINERTEFQQITEKINQIKKKEISILTFDNYFMIWSIFKEIKHIYLVNHTWTPKKDYMIENDLINAFKILGLNNKDFLEFLENKNEGWRYYNINVAKFFQMKYQANSLNTFNNSENFDEKIKNFIQKSSPLLTQQIVIPIEELYRLNKKFTKMDLYNISKPDIIILDRIDIFSRSKINSRIYCRYNEYRSKILYIKKKLTLNCN